MVEQTIEAQISNLETQETYVGMAFDLLNAGTFPGHFAKNILETQLYLKGFHTQLGIAKKQLQDRLPKPVEPVKSSISEPITPDVVSEVK